MAKRILQIIPTLDRCGAEKQLTLLAKGLPRDEFDVSVCALTRGGPLLEDLQAADIPTTIIGKRWKIDPMAYWRLKRHIRELKPDLVQTWIFAANAYGRSAALACKVPCVVANERCVDPWKRGYELAIDRYLAKRSTQLVTNSTGVSAFYASKGIPEDRFEVIPNGIRPFDGEPIPREKLLEELGLPDDIKLIGMVARFWPQKRIKDAIWAADLLRVIRDDVHLLIIGDGPEEESLLRYRENVQIEDHVHFLGRRDDVPRILPNFDLVWSTSAYEGQSNSIMEAMSAGVPVVAIDIPGNDDLVTHGETGWLVEDYGPDYRRRRAALARQSAQVLDDSDLLDRIGQAAAQRMRDEFSVERMVERYADLYRRLLNG